MQNLRRAKHCANCQCQFRNINLCVSLHYLFMPKHKKRALISQTISNFWQFLSSHMSIPFRIPLALLKRRPILHALFWVSLRSNLTLFIIYEISKTKYPSSYLHSIRESLKATGTSILLTDLYFCYYRIILPNLFAVFWVILARKLTLVWKFSLDYLSLSNNLRSISGRPPCTRISVSTRSACNKLSSSFKSRNSYIQYI